MSQKKPVLSRRNFLLSVGASGAAGAVAIASKTTGIAPDSKDKRATSGYKVSAHIENYYRTTKV